MSFRKKITPSNKNETIYVIQNYTNPQTHKRTSRVYERIGTVASLKTEYGVNTRDEVMKVVDDYIEQLRNAQKQEKLDQIVTLTYNLKEKLPKGAIHSYNVSWMYIYKVLAMLGLKDICGQVAKKHRFKFDLEHILSTLVCGRMLFPGSKLFTQKESENMLFWTAPVLDHVYKSLPYLAKHRYEIEAALYENSKKIVNRDSSVVYYDCTNFYFETEEEDLDEEELRKYGKSKENRPNPIVQYGLLVDRSHIPVGDICFPGNRNEQHSLPKLEQIVEEKFGVSRFIVCADAGLNCLENRRYNDRKHDGAYIVTDPIKKFNADKKDWALDPKGWSVIGCDKVFNLNDLDEIKGTIEINGETRDLDDVIFYKTRMWRNEFKSKVTGKKEILDERLIVSYSTRYKKYNRHIRQRKLERAEKLLDKPGNIKTKDQRNPRYYIKQLNYAADSGEVVGDSAYEIDYEKVAADEKFDGFYAVATDLVEDDMAEIIAINKNRWEIEECFEIMKSELLTRPMYVWSKEGIEAHLLICFMALLVFRIMEQLMGEKYTCPRFFSELRKMNVVYEQGPYYRGAFTRTDLTDDLAEIFGYEFGMKLLHEKTLKKFERNAKAKKLLKLKKV